MAPKLAEAGGCFARVGSIFWLAFQPEAPRSLEAIASGGMSRYADLHAALLERGVYFAPSGYEVGFLSDAMTEEDVGRLCAAVTSALARLGA